MSGERGIGPETIDSLKARVKGKVLVAGDKHWPEASMAWSLVPQVPLAVVRAASVDDVVEVVRWTAEHGASVAAQPGGHGATGTATDAILLRTGALDHVHVDADARTARIGAGAKWGAVLPRLEGTGLVAPAGSNPDVTPTGYLLGGGLSWFSRAVGYACQSLRAAEVVDAEGNRRRVDDESDPDLMWALRGGGGDLVVVTEVEIDLHPAEGLYGGKLLFPVSDARAVLEAFVEVTRTAPRELTLWASVLHFPDVDLLPEPMRGQSFVSVDATFLGAADEGRRLLDPVRAAGTLVDDTTSELPIGRLGDVSAEPTDPTPSVDWGCYLRDFTPDAAARLAEATADPSRTALNIVQVRHVGGALADPPAPRPAVSDRASAQYVVGAIGIPMSAELVERIRGSIREVADVLADELSDEPMPLNFIGPGEPLSRAFDEETLARLRSLKQRLDPAGTIRGAFPLMG